MVCATCQVNHMAEANSTVKVAIFIEFDEFDEFCIENDEFLY